jgi:hypothetical protein
MSIKVNNLAVLTLAGWSDGWRPIVVAPEGVDILLCWADGTQRVGYNNGKGWLCDGVGFDSDPAYWMPLPAPADGSAT